MMPDNILDEFYISLIDDEISKIVMTLINEEKIENDEDYEKILEDCLGSLETGD